VDALPQIIQGIVGGLLGALPELVQAGWQLLKGLLEGILKAVPELLKGVKDVALSLIDAFLGLFGIHSPSTVFAEMGGNLLKGLWQGIANARDWLFDRVRQLGHDLVASIKGMFGIASPSKLFRDEIGANLALGLGEGFEAAMKNVSRDMQDAVPTDFSIDARVRGGFGRTQRSDGAPPQVAGGFSLTLRIENFYNNTEKDLRQLADELSTLMADGIRRKGLVT